MHCIGVLWCFTNSLHVGNQIRLRFKIKNRKLITKAINNVQIWKSVPFQKDLIYKVQIDDLQTMQSLISECASGICVLFW